jgi:dihydrofolate reductase
MIRLVAAIDKKGGLARDSQIPWDLPEDVAHFRSLTMTHGSNVLMGHKTFEMFTTPLKSRHIYIVSHQDLQLPDGSSLVKDIDEFMPNFKEDLWVAGGASVYAQAIKYADELYLTVVDSDFNCDQFFPDYSNFKLKEQSDIKRENGLEFSYQLFTRF